MPQPLDSFFADAIILIELNELCPNILLSWMSSGDLPNFKRLYDRSTTFITSPDVEDFKYLEPWIQWYSLHTGLPFSDHGVFNLTDGPRAGHDDLWHLLKQNGKRVMNCGSMNAKRFEGDGNIFISDPWCADQDAWPQELNSFQNFVAQNVQEHSQANGKAGKESALSFLRFMASHGLSMRTAADLTKQILSEKTKDKRLSYKRVAQLDQLQYDIFRHYYRKKRPAFATYFSNSVAHLQHSFWRHMDPDAFTVKPEQNEMALYRDAVKFGYKSIDKIIGHILDDFGDEATLIFATALSQQPFTKYEAQGGQHFYRPRDIEGLLNDIGISFEKVEPVMTHQYMLHCRSKEDADAAERALKFCTAENKQVFDVRRENETSMYFGAQISIKVGEDAPFSGPGEFFTDFHSHFYQIDQSKSGCHHPDGCLWIETGNAKHMEDERISILDIAPTIMALLGADKAIPSNWQGKSLTPRLGA